MSTAADAADACAAGVRLQKYLAARGAGSRRHCEQLIRAGAVTVNGVVVSALGTRVDERADRVAVRGVPVAARAAPARTVLLHKPRGYVCAAAGAGRLVGDLVADAGADLKPVGRLDKDSEGLLLMSNDGNLILRLTHPRFGTEKAYRATVSGAVNDAALRRLRAPFVLDGYETRPARVKALKAGDKPGRTILEFVLPEGRNRQVRRMCEAAGLEVHRLVRTRVGPLTLGGLAPGRWRELTPAEAAALGTEE